MWSSSDYFPPDSRFTLAKGGAKATLTHYPVSYGQWDSSTYSPVTYSPALNAGSWWVTAESFSKNFLHWRKSPHPRSCPLPDADWAVQVYKGLLTLSLGQLCRAISLPNTSMLPGTLVQAFVMTSFCIQSSFTQFIFFNSCGTREHFLARLLHTNVYIQAYFQGTWFKSL